MIETDFFDNSFNSAFIKRFRSSDLISHSNNIVRYHYTSSNGLISILNANKETAMLRFTDIRFMNDKSEQVYFVKILLEYLIKHKAEYPNALEVVNELLLKQHSADDYINLNLTEVEYSNIPQIPYEESRNFIFCTSESSDSLNMWNYYVKSGNYQGYNIGINIFKFLKSFDINELEVNDPIIFTYGKVVYSKADQTKEIKQILDKIEAYGKDEFSNAMAMLQHIIGVYSVFFKHKSFADEREYRIVIHLAKNQVNDSRDYCNNKNNRNIKYDFFERNGILVPCLYVPLVKEAVDSITIAPMVEYSIAKSSIEDYLSINGYKAKVRKSDIPIRF